MTKDFRLTPLRKKVKNIKLCELSGRTTAVQMASLEAIRYLPSRAGAKPDTMTVRTEVRRPGEALVTINSRLYQRDVEWFVYDILVDGISLVSNYRSTFAEEISKKGISGLVSLLEKKNQQPVIQSNADLIKRRASRACRTYLKIALAG